MVVQKILRLQVSVCDPQVVQVPHPRQNHPEGPSRVPLSEVASTDDTIQQLPTSGQFQHHVNPLWELEHLNHLNHIRVPHPLQHGHLWRTHFAGLWSQELHHFYGKRLVGCSVLHPYDAAEATTTDQGFDVISDTAGKEKKKKNTSQYKYLRLQSLWMDGQIETTRPKKVINSEKRGTSSFTAGSQIS